ncbi:hypothetical protein HJC99_02690 [Candidatus Saccharibacteria bacterium]|nr:hypothetical protein [Candidatus Saccharibacteria bacterium]
MPEGPQARQVANLIQKHVGEMLVAIRHPASRIPWDIKLPTVISRVETKGKNIFVYLESGQIIYNHMLMWGW